MKQQIEVKATNALIIKGVDDLSRLLYNQTDIKPECYLPAIQYLKEFANKFLQDKSAEQSLEEKQTTVVECTNSDVRTAIIKIKNMLYRQIAIKPEVYLILISKLNDYDAILKYQDENGVADNNATKKTIDETKKTDINLTSLKNMFK